MSQIQPRRARHLIDPSAPRPQRSDPMSLTQVQRWVMSVLATTTIAHLAAGIVIAAYFLDSGRAGGQLGLLVIAGCFGMIAVAVGFVLHKKSALNPWLVLGWIPSIVGAWFIWH